MHSRRICWREGIGASSVTVRFGAVGTPLADARGLEQSHDREGVEFHEKN